MLNPLDNRQKNNVPKAEPCCLLSSNTDVVQGSAFGFPEVERSVEEQIDLLAQIIVTAYFYRKRNTN